MMSSASANAGRSDQLGGLRQSTGDLLALRLAFDRTFESVAQNTLLGSRRVTSGEDLLPDTIFFMYTSLHIA